MFPADQTRQIFQIQVSSSRWDLFEWCDLAITPSFVKHCCQAMLTAQWTHKLPLIQQIAPAEMASRLIQAFLDDFPDVDSERYFIIDFCSGAGGPIPIIEKSINSTRTRKNQPPIPFRLSDYHPNLDAWMLLASHSANLSFIPQSVDATATTHLPALIISKTSALPNTNDHKTIHLYCLSFHHFNDTEAQKVMQSTLATADALAIIELQDRSLGMLMLMLGEFALLFLLTIFWFPHDILHLVFTYCMPVLPFVQAWDGMVSCLRTRTFYETLALAERALGKKAKVVSVEDTGIGEYTTLAVCGEWKFVGVRRLHTWPFGYMNAFLAQKR